MRSYILKADPAPISDDGLVEVTLRAFGDGGSISPGDECFLWFSESSGGQGLTGRGIVRTVTQGGGGLKIEAKIDHQIYSDFRIANIEPFRDDEASPQGMIARKLYKHAHNKIVEVSSPEADLLKKHLSPKG